MTKTYDTLTAAMEVTETAKKIYPIIAVMLTRGCSVPASYVDDQAPMMDDFPKYWVERVSVDPCTDWIVLNTIWRAGINDERKLDISVHPAFYEDLVEVLPRG